jgi:hypothetical protein
LAGLLLGDAVADVTFVGVEEEPAQGVELLAFVELAADAPAELLVDEPGEHEVRLDQPPVFLQRSGERVAAASGLRAGEQQRRGSPPVPQRRGEAEQLIPVGRDELRPELVLEELVDVGGWRRVVPVETLAVEITDPGREPQAKDVIRGSAGNPKGFHRRTRTRRGRAPRLVGRDHTLATRASVGSSDCRGGSG